MPAPWALIRAPLSAFYAKLCSLAKLSHAATPHRGILACPVMRTWHENAPFATQIVVHACASPTDFKIRFGNTHLTIMRLASWPWLTFWQKVAHSDSDDTYQAHLFSILWQLKRRFHTWSNQKRWLCVSFFFSYKSVRLLCFIPFVTIDNIITASNLSAIDKAVFC